MRLRPSALEDAEGLHGSGREARLRGGREAGLRGGRKARLKGGWEERQRGREVRPRERG